MAFKVPPQEEMPTAGREEEPPAGLSGASGACGPFGGSLSGRSHDLVVVEQIKQTANAVDQGGHLSA